MIEAIHQSSLNMILRCGEQFRRRYMMGEIIPPGIAAGRGTGVHAANEANLKQKIFSGVDLPIGDMKDAARDGYVRAFKNGVYIPRDQVSQKTQLLNNGLNETLELTKLYGDEVAPEIEPVEVEREFFIDVGLPIPLAGKIDIERKAKVDDLKTSSKKWPEGQIEKEIQPAFYSYVHEKETGVRPEFVYHILRVLKRGAERQIQRMTPTDVHYNALFAKLHGMVRMIETGVFPYANPTEWYCNPRWCGFYDTCKGVGNSPTKLWV